MDSNRKPLLPTGNGWKQSKGIAIVALLIFGAVSAVMVYSPHNAFAAVTITSSGDTFFGSAFARVLITDSALLGSPTDKPNAVVEAKRGSTTLGSVTAPVEEIGTSGTFELFVTTRNGAGNDPAAPTKTSNTDAPLTGPGAAIVVRINTAPAGDGNDRTIDLNGASAADSTKELQSGDSIVVTYGGSSKTINFSTSSATLSSDRSTAGEGDQIIIKLKDQDGNNDPTAVDTFNLATADLKALIGGVDKLLGAPVTLAENGQNTGEFEATINVGGSVNPRIDLTGNPLPQGVTVQASNLDVYSPQPAGAVAPFNAQAPTAPQKVSVSVTLQNTDGTITLTSPPSFANGLKIQITDPDRNINSQSTNSLGIVTGTVTLGGTQTHVITDNGAGDTSEAYTVSGITVTTTTATGSGTITIISNSTYSADPGATTVGAIGAPTGTGAGLTIGTITSTIAVTGTGASSRLVTLTVPYTTTAALTGAAVGTITVPLTSTTAAPTLNAVATGSGSPTATFTSTTNAVTVTVAGVTGTVTGLTLDETDKNTGIFTLTNTENRVPITFTSGADSVGPTGISLSVTGIKGDPDISITYTDPAGSPTGAKTSVLVTKLPHTGGSLTGPSASVGVTDTFTLTLTDPDLNTSNNTVETYVIQWAGVSTSTVKTIPSGASATTAVGTFTAKAAGSAFTPTAGSPLTLTFIETTASSGIFTATNGDMSVINSVVTGGLKDGDKVEFEYIDRMQSPDASSTATLTVGKPTAAITVDRTTVPVPESTTDSVKIVVKITDPTKNLSTGSTDSFSLADTGITITDSAGNAVTGTPSTKIAGLVTKTFTETGLSTGVFTATYSISQASGGLSIALLNGAKIKFTYGTESASATLKTFDGILTTDTGNVNNGSVVKITVTDPDANKDATTKDSVTVALETKSDKIETGTLSPLTLDETSENSGTFTKTQTIGSDIKVGDLTNNKFATSILFTYTDKLASDNTANVARELTIKVGATSGSLTVTPEKVGPGTKITIIVDDKDLNVNPQGTDIKSASDYLRITSDRSGVNTLTTATGEETGPNTGQFKTTLALSPLKSGATATFAGTGKDITGTVLPGDLVSIRYTDNKDIFGNKITVSKTFQVTSVNPEITTDQTTAAADASFTVTIADIDANTDGDAVDSLKLRITSTRDPVGYDATALETGPNTGVFTVVVSTTTGVSAGSITVRQGDSITVKYNDRFPADYADRVKQVVDASKDFSIILPVGVDLGGVKSTSPGPATPTTVEGKQISEVKVGMQVILLSSIKNNQDADRDFVAVIQTTDSSGAVVSIKILSSKLPAKGEVKVGGDFTPDAAGTYKVKVFVLSDLASPIILATPSETTLNVS